MLHFKYNSNYSSNLKIKLILFFIIFYSFIYLFFADHHFSDQDNFSKNMKEHITSRIYISVIIQSEIGLGHVFPTSNIMRIIISSQALISLIIALL